MLLGVAEADCDEEYDAVGVAVELYDADAVADAVTEGVADGDGDDVADVL